MESKELMIGDWVYRYDKPIQVTDGIYQGKVYTTDMDVVETKLNPIPLTEEILRKNGFVVCSNNRYMNMSNGVDIILRKNYIRVCVGSNRIDIRNKSVHSFQQILRILDKRELADNFTI